MRKNSLSRYSESPYLLIGFERKDDPVLTDLNHKNSIDIKYIFNHKIDFENCIIEHKKNEKIIFIVSSDLLSDEIMKFQNYSQIDAIYSCYQSEDFTEEFICIYKKPEKKNYFKSFLKLLKELWFIIGLIIVIVLAYLFPKVGSSTGPLYAKYTIKMGCVFIIFLLSSLSLPLKKLLNDILNYRLHLSTQIYSLILVPFFIFGIALLLNEASINQTLILGLIVMGCVPTSNSINIVATKYCGGNEAGTLLNVLFGSIIGIFLSPAMITMFMTISNIAPAGQSFDIGNYTGVLIQLSITVLAPIVIGQVITFIWTDQMMWAKEKLYFAEITVVAVLLIIWANMCDLFLSGILKSVDTSDLLIIILFVGLFYVIFLISTAFIATVPISFNCRRQKKESDQQPLLQDNKSKSRSLIQRWRFNHEDTISFMFCGATKTLALGVPLITALYPDSTTGYISLVTIPLVLYDVEQIVLTSIAIRLMQRIFPAEDKKDKKDQK